MKPELKSLLNLLQPSLCLLFVAALAVQAVNVNAQLSQSNQDEIIVQSLQNMEIEGFNSYLPPPGGLYINWIYTNNPPVSTNDVNIEGNGIADPNPTTRHDPLTDVEFLAALCLYSQVYPYDTQFDATMTTYTQVLQDTSDDNFLAKPQQDGWVYWALNDIASVIPSFNGYQYAMATNFYHIYTNNLVNKYNNNITPLYEDFPTNCPTGTYNTALTLEGGCVLIVAGEKLGNPNYVTAGQNLISFVQSNAYSTKLEMWADTMGNLFTSTNFRSVSSPSQQFIYASNVDVGEISEECEALCYADSVDPGHGYGTLATNLLNRLDPNQGNYFGLWDTTYGGYYEGINLAGATNVQSGNLSFNINTAYKEVGRAATMTRAFLAANNDGANYSTNTLQGVNAANLNSYYTNGHGWPYQEYDNYSIYSNHITSPSNYYVAQIWVTSESISHAVRALLTEEINDFDVRYVTDTDIGSPGKAGSASYSDGVWTVKGGGAYIYNHDDQFNYAYEPCPPTNVVTITAEVLSVENVDPITGHSRGGVMIRSSAAANAANAYIALNATSTNGIEFTYRTTNGDSTASVASQYNVSPPYWVGLVESGSNFSGYISSNGEDWTLLGTAVVTMAGTPLAGLAVTANDNTNLCTSTFTNVVVAP